MYVKGIALSEELFPDFPSAIEIFSVFQLIVSVSPALTLPFGWPLFPNAVGSSFQKFISDKPTVVRYLSSSKWQSEFPSGVGGDQNRVSVTKYQLHSSGGQRHRSKWMLKVFFVKQSHNTFALLTLTGIHSFFLPPVSGFSQSVNLFLLLELLPELAVFSMCRWRS